MWQYPSRVYLHFYSEQHYPHGQVEIVWQYPSRVYLHFYLIKTYSIYNTKKWQYPSRVYLHFYTLVGL